MALNGTMILKDTQGKLLTTQLDSAIPAGFNGGTPLVPDCRVTITSVSTGLWKVAGLSYDAVGRLSVTSVGPIDTWVAGIPLDDKGRVYISNDPVAFYSQDGIPITFGGAVSMGVSYGPDDMFSNGEQGMWYDPSDFNTMFQDTAGTIPVTAEEQYVGMILDKSGNNNHAIAPETKPLLRKDEMGLYYLDFDGSSTYMMVPSVNFSTTDKLTTWAGIRKFFDDIFYLE